MSDPAPPPCEACKTYLRSEPSHIALNEWLKMFDEHHRIIAALTAENERLREMLQSVIDHEDSVLWTRAERNRLSREARALLTEEGKP